MATRDRVSPKRRKRAKSPDRTAAIRRATERAGIKPRGEQSTKALVFSPECMAWAEKIGVPLDATTARMWESKQLGERKLVFTLDELVKTIGFDIEVTDFAACALDRIAEQIAEQIADQTDAVSNGNGVGGAQWRNFNSIADRAVFAAKIQRQLAGGEP